MKRMHVLSVAILSMLTMGNIAYGYTFGFTNLMAGPVDIRIKLSGINEPWYTAHLRGAKESGAKDKVYEFEFQVDAKVPSDMKRKFGFCLSQIQVQPYELNDKGQWEATGLWYDADPRFVESNYFNKMLAAASKFSDGFKDAAGGILKTVAKGLDPASAAAVGGAGVAVKAIPLGKMVESIGGIVAYSLCKDRHFHILPNIDTNGEEQPGPVVATNAR